MKRKLTISLVAVGSTLLMPGGACLAQSHYDASKNSYVFWPGWDRVDPNAPQSLNRIGNSLRVRLGARIGTSLTESVGDMMPAVPGPTTIGSTADSDASAPTTLSSPMLGNPMLDKIAGR